MNGVVDAVEFVGAVPVATFLNELGGAIEHPGIQLFELIVGESVARRIEVAEVAESEAERVADFPIGFAELGHDALAHFHVSLILDGSYPEAQQIAAPAFADLDGIERIAKRLGHGAAQFVQRPAVSDHAAIRRGIADPGRDQQGAVKPAAVLIRALKINVCGPLRAFQHGQVRRAGIEPDIENVVFLAPV